MPLTNTDYYRSFMDLYDLLPDVYKSDTNRAAFYNTFNRFLTKNEVTKIAGYIGDPNKKAIIRRQIEEDTIHRQANQLQPILNAIIGSVKHFAAWEDIRKEIERLGVDSKKMNSWGSVQKFNWVPPVDIDKLINYYNYYWVDTQRSYPEYITMKSRCAVAVSLVSFWEKLIKEYGSTAEIDEVLTYSQEINYPIFNISQILGSINTIIVKDDVSDYLSKNNFFYIFSTQFNNGKHQIENISYDINQRLTTINVTPGTLDNSSYELSGTLKAKFFDKISLVGDYSKIFTKDFIFFIKNSNNQELNQSFWKSVESTYDTAENRTIVKLNDIFTNETSGGTVSFDEQYQIALSTKSCVCNETSEWDIGQWDDNPMDPLWGGFIPGLHAKWLSEISNDEPPPITIATDQWYDTVNDILYGWNDVDNPPNYEIITRNFSFLLNQTQGIIFWDETASCNTAYKTGTADQWVDDNRWLHYKDVKNFTTAKKAQLPIIEYQWDLAINEWSQINHKWKYRTLASNKWVETTTKPELIELTPIELWEIGHASNAIEIDERYGDLTDTFVEGYKFTSFETNETFNVMNSYYSRKNSTSHFTTKIIIDKILIQTGLLPGNLNNETNSITPLIPLVTTQGDDFKKYGDHWLYIQYDEPIASPSKPKNLLIDPPNKLQFTTDPSGDFDYKLTPYSQIMKFNVNGYDKEIHFMDYTFGDSNRKLNKKALFGYGDVRVYINDERKYGSFDEIEYYDPINEISYVGGIKMLDFILLTANDVLRIEVGEGIQEELGLYCVPVRIYEKNNDYKNNGDVKVSLISHKKTEQIKTKDNQYPLFDIFNPIGSHAGIANHIFGYKISPEYDANNIIDQRIVYDPLTKVYDFEQYLIEEDNGPIYAYRDHSNLKNNYWFNPQSNVLLMWIEGEWSFKSLMGNHYRRPIVSAHEPEYKDKSIHGLLWYDIVNNELKIRDVYNQKWNVIDDVMVSLNDHTLQTIWRSGQNKEVYTPEKVDWDKRTHEEYNAEREIFVEETYPELMKYNPDMTKEEAIQESIVLWHKRETNSHSPSITDDQGNVIHPGGYWVGDWEIPDPLYYNHMHENRKTINSAELRIHLQGIIENQPPIPGYTGGVSDMFRLIPINDVNYGVAGTIHEYNDGFDTFLSSAFINNVTPISLIDFAVSQYEILLINTIVDVFRQNITEYLTNVSPDAQKDIDKFIHESIINEHEKNDYFNSVYGDTTVYNDKENKGVPNWIATLPYINVMHARRPNKLIDENRGINELRHHDGHFGEYQIHPSEEINLINNLLNTEDNRGIGNDTWGKKSTNPPPNNLTEFTSSFNSINNRSGVYWYTVIPNSSVLYRFNVVHIGFMSPLGEFDDGALWFDTTFGGEVLRNKKTNIENHSVWEVVDGLTVGDGRLHNGSNPNDISNARVSVWNKTSINQILVETIYNIELALYENAPTDPIRYDVNETRSLDPLTFDKYLADAFLDFITDQNIVNPFSNVEYVDNDPWTWNYSYSIPGGGYNIIDADSDENELHISGNHAELFDPCYNILPCPEMDEPIDNDPSCTPAKNCPSQISFYIKNSIVNDGSWSTIVSEGKTAVAYSYQENNEIKTAIKVEGTISPSIQGFIYLGVLPGSNSTGAENASYWKNYYRELYETPYPHLEPWKLQGYVNQPEWWDKEYLNNDSHKWGNRKWKYKHGFEIKEFSNIFGRGSFLIDGEFLDVFLPGNEINIDNSDLTENFTHSATFIHSIRSIDSNLLSIDVDGDLENFYTNDKILGIANKNNNYVGSYRVKHSSYMGPPSFNTRIYLKGNISNINNFSSISSVYYIYENQTIIQTDASIQPKAQKEIQYGRIVKAYGMWENIRTGAVPPGKNYPNGIISKTGIPSKDRKTGIEIDDLETWNYFSVNIDNLDHSDNEGETVYSSDDLLPPYWNHYAAIEPVNNTSPELHDKALIPVFDNPIRSVYSDYLGEIIAPSADYVFGDGGPSEWEWRKSSKFLYDTLKASYRLDPVRYVCHTFGIDFYILNDLQIDTKTNNTFAHNRTNFHGDIVNNEAQSYSGTNQWYVNYNRYLGFDNNFADFANMWKGWSAPMTYQFATFVDTPSLQVGHRYVPFTKYDYSIDTKRSPGVNDYWMDAFQVNIVKTPPDIMRYNTENQWGIEINTHVSISRNINYYDVQNYQFYIDPETDVGIIYTWSIKEVDIYNRFFEIEGDQSHYFNRDNHILIYKSLGNNGYYTIYNSMYNEQTNRTIIQIDEPIKSITVDGLLTMDKYRELPWETGEKIHINSTESMPSPLESKTSTGLNSYFFIKLTEHEFQIADTKEDALAGNAIDILSVGRGDHHVGKIHSIFKSLKTNTIGLKTNIDWIHYEMDNTKLANIQLPTIIKGMQTFINFIDGYALYIDGLGWRINDQNSMTDRITNRLVSWQGEIEKFIDYAYTIRAHKYSVSDKYEIITNSTDNEFEFVNDNPMFTTGDRIKFLSNDGKYPDPIYRYLDYNYIYIDGQRFKIAGTKRDAELGRSLEILSNGNNNKLYIHKPKNKRSEYPRTGLNPFRQAIWFMQPEGVISNIISGPTEDIRTVQTIVDQYGRRVDVGNIRVFREDRRTQISMKKKIQNIIEPPVYHVYPGDYDYIHIGGLHLFIDTYEHVMVFNNYTTDGDLLYDPFIGLNATKFEMLFNKQVDFTQRPNIGGYYLYDKNNLGSQLIENIEAGVESLRYAFDTFEVLESNKMAQEVRKTLGYTGLKDYLSVINVNQKSQFLFWKGFIHQKGTTRSIDAYLNSIRIVNAIVDEFWAIKIAEFGSSKDKEYIEMYLNTDDLISNESGFEFEDTKFNVVPIPEIPEIPEIPTAGPNYGCKSRYNLLSLPVKFEGMKDFYVPIFIEMGNIIVYVNGVKLSSGSYEQRSNTEIKILSPVVSKEDVIEAGTLSLIECDYGVIKKTTRFVNSKNEKNFTTNFTCPVGNLNIFINGTKLTNTQFIQTDVNSFSITEEILSDHDVVEAESWISNNDLAIEELMFKKSIYFTSDNIEIDQQTFTFKNENDNDYIVYINGTKISIRGFVSKGRNSFTLVNKILSKEDTVEIERWIYRQDI